MAILIGCSDDSGPTGDPPIDAGHAENGSDAGTCSRDCDDGSFCTGVELCNPDDPRADGDGCVSPGRDCDDGVACTVDACDDASEACTHAGSDADADGHLDATCLDAAGEPFGDDCDDANAARFPGNVEVCDAQNVDEDCDPATFGHQDVDADGVIAASCCNADASGDLRCGLDCDDEDLAVHAKQPEFCDALDNDCDGEVDEVENEVAWYADSDGDGFGTTGSVTLSCTPIAGRSLVQTDCDDAEAAVHPASQEQCDDIDNDCDGTADDGLTGCATAPIEPPTPRIDECLNDLHDCHEQAQCRDLTNGYLCSCASGWMGEGHGASGCQLLLCAGKAPGVWYDDADEDDYGDPDDSVVACSAPHGHVANDDDCDDGASARHPGASDTDCDQVDQDCDGTADDGHVASVSCDAGDAAWLLQCTPTGLECACVASGGGDTPGDLSDSDCDGFDGTITTSIFLAPGSGVDCTGTDGTAPATPCTNVQAAIDRAQSEGKQVIAEVGTYTSSQVVTLRSGVSIYGGFDFATGRLATSGRTILRRQSATHSVAAAGSALNATTRLVNLQLTATTPTSEGFGAYALVCDGCTGLVLDRVVLVSESGAAGVAGDDGPASTVGANGSSGRFEYNDGSAGGAGGPGRSGADTATGYRGGNGASAAVCGGGDTYYQGEKGLGSAGGNPAPLNGSAAAQPGGGGAGGAIAAVGGVGVPGWTTQDGTELWWITGVGSSGPRGNAGSGGGGGRAYCDYGAVNSWYWSGGGGGGGGQGGFGGVGGHAGGSSIGLMLRDSSGVSLVSVEIQVGAGGVGGEGGIGGNGALGGSGGPAPSNGPMGEPVPTFAAGAGGGRGGGAGGGGGGPAGASILLLIDQSTAAQLDDSSVTYSVLPGVSAGGAGGLGGNQGLSGQGAVGEQGTAGTACERFEAESTAMGICD